MTEAEKVVAFLDSLSPEEHIRRIEEARLRIDTRRSDRRERARRAAERLRD